jgi:hypothetical protein
MGRKRLVLFVEGESDAESVPILVKRILTDLNAWTDVILDDAAFRVGNVHNLTGRKQAEWLLKLGAARKRPDAAAVLVVLDGDERKVEGQPFCAARVARLLAERAREAGAGTQFSVACVFACREYESWLLAAIECLKGKLLCPENRPGVRGDAAPIESDTEQSPRDAKRELGRRMHNGYKASTDQKPLTELLDLNALRGLGLRSFRRLDHAVADLVQAIRAGKPLA